ncbi:hypothetical protein REPUB_Repub07fG0237400 [Reevesia pubescens]
MMDHNTMGGSLFVRRGVLATGTITRINEWSRPCGMGGIVIADKNGNSPPMGSGHLVDNDYTHSCYFFRNIHFIDDKNQLQTPNNDATSQIVEGCYGLIDRKDCGHKQMHYCFTFGGPGSANCGR